MGVIYKLKPAIKVFILEEKRADPKLSCRSLAALIENKFQIKLSKSSINTIIKEEGLSMPVGRRQKKKRRKRVSAPQPPEVLKLAAPAVAKEEAVVEEEIVEVKVETPSEKDCSGAIILKAADCLIGGSHYITEAIRKRLNRQENGLLAKTESLIYLPLFEPSAQTQAQGLSRLWALIDKELAQDHLLSYLNEIQSVNTIALDLLRIIPNVLQEVRCIKVHSSDGNILYLDGQLHTVWSTTSIPYDFATTIYNIKSYINNYFLKELPIVLFMAPGYDRPTEDFFNFILGLESKGKRISTLTLHGNELEELEAIRLEQYQRLGLIFGLWPWQFVEFRKVNSLQGFRPFFSEVLKKEIYIAEIEISLSQPIAGQSVILRGYALKFNPTEKTRLVILSNLTSEMNKPEDLLSAYFSHWPNGEEAFQDYSHKIELFTYTASSHRFFSVEHPLLNKEAPPDIKTLLYHYLKALDLYVKWHFLPSGFEDKDFSTIKEHFYDLQAILQKEKGRTTVTFQPPQGFRFLKELEYVCRRLNEREILFTDTSRLWFSL